MAITINNPQYTYAGFWIRSLAYILDLFIIRLPISIIIIALLLKGYLGIHHGIRPIIALLPSVIFAFMIASSWQATLGKKIARVFIIRKGTKISFLFSLLRSCMFLAVAWAITISVNKLVPLKPVAGEFENNISQIEEKFFAIIPEAKNILEKNHLTLGQALYISAPEKNETAEPRSKSFTAIENLIKNKSAEEKAQIDIIVKDLKEAENKKDRHIRSDRMARTSTIVFFLMILWYAPIFFTKEKTAFHDIILKTRVVKGRAKNYYSESSKEIT